MTLTLINLNSDIHRLVTWVEHRQKQKTKPIIVAHSKLYSCIELQLILSKQNFQKRKKLLIFKHSTSIMFNQISLTHLSVFLKDLDEFEAVVPEQQH